MRSIYTLLLILFLCSCQESREDQAGPQQKSANIDVSLCEDGSHVRNLVYQKGGATFLWGGEDSTTHFNISNFQLDVCKLQFGLGREHFKALIRPAYVHPSQLKYPIDSTDKAVVIHLANGSAKIYPYSILHQHETINDVVDGKPVAVVLCFLADLAVVYDRVYCNKPLTFAVSGYTYLDRNILEGLESFMLWDRDTESLWWPIVDRGVSGDFRGQAMTYSDLNWEIMRWGEAVERYPNAEVLAPGQTMKAPGSWPRRDGC